MSQYTIKALKTKTNLFYGTVKVCSDNRPDHVNLILAWCDMSGIRVANDPRSTGYIGRYAIKDGQVVRNI
jgi:hypothetical protein